MVSIIIDLNKTVDENAALYFQHAKLLKKKIEGAEKTVEVMSRKLLNAENKKNKKTKKKIKTSDAELPHSWFAKFRWFFTQHGFLVVGAKDAGSNELIIKKYLSQNDLVFHTEAPGSPFFILKLDRFYSDEELKTIKEDIESTAQLTASYSKAWSLNLVYTDVFYVRPEQITKKAKAGEYLSRGSFMVYGKRNFLTVKLELSVGVKSSGSSLVVFTQDYVSSLCKKYVVLTPGSIKKSDAVKRIIKILLGKNANSLDVVEVNNEKVSLSSLHDVLLSLMPPGNFNIEKS